MSTPYKLSATRAKIAIGIALPLFIFVHNPFTALFDNFFSKPITATIVDFILAAIIFTAMWHFQPWTHSRFHLPRNLGYKWIVIALIFAYELIPVFKAGQLPFKSLPIFFGALAYSFGTGLFEESFSRGLIFGTLERKNIWLSATFASITFGLFHFTNLKIGHSISYTTMQALGAMGMGFLFTGLMIFSGSIWVPILLHSLYDFPLITIPDLGKASFKLTFNDFAWAFGEVGYLAVVGLLLIYFGTSGQNFFQMLRSPERLFSRAK